jgi:hypothetical protein
VSDDHREWSASKWMIMGVVTELTGVVTVKMAVSSVRSGPLRQHVYEW